MKKLYFNCDLQTGSRALGDLRFCFDPTNDGKLIRGALVFRGWIVHKSQAISKVICRRVDDGTSISTTPGIFRPGVFEGLRKYRNSNAAGFVLELSDPRPGDIQISAVTLEGVQYLLDTIRITAYDRPKLLFMHIAKTAGTTVNSYFESQYPKNLTATHIESNERWQTDLDYVRKLEFLSGHIRLAQFKEKLDLSEYYKVTLLREPFSHLTSHLAWIKHLSEPAEAGKLVNYPEYVQELSKKLWEADLSNPSTLARVLESLHGKEIQLLDNCQSRYFIQPEPGQWIGENDFQCAKSTLGEFDKIGLSESTDQFLREISEELQFERLPDEVRHNIAKSHYGLDVTKVEICEIMHPLVQYDIRLYEFVKSEVTEDGPT